MNYEEMTKEELIDYINSLNETNTGKFGLIWDKEKEPEKIVQECDRNIPILVENPLRTINKGENTNLLIEGDNFHSLSVLNYTHKESVDVIYIDPPYNTGNDGFIYNDKFVDPEDGYRHSKWLNFMEKRLVLARDLLKDDGIIFISIDDNEFAHLKLLCDRIFGDNSFVKIINVELSTTQGMKVKAAKQGNIVKNCEYILVYSKDGHKNIGLNPLKDPVKYDSHYNKYLVYNEDNKCFNEYNLIDIINSQEELKKEIEFLKLTNLSEIYEKTILTHKWINDNAGNICRNHDSVDVPDEIKNNYEVNLIYEYESDNRSYLVAKDKNGKISQRILLSEKICLCDDFYESYSPSRIRGDLWTGFYLDMGNVSKEGGVNFDNGKKPVRLIKQLLKFTTNKDAVILDFFAGSGTTGQAVLELNKEDNGNRQFILCTNNELSKELQKQFRDRYNVSEEELKIIKNNPTKEYMDYIEENGICSSKTYNRLKNVIEGYNSRDGLESNLKYYKCEFVENSNNRDQLYFDLTEKCVPMLCVKENCFNIVKSTSEYSIFTNNDKTKYTCVYYDLFGEYENSFIDEIKNISENKILYIFSLGESIDDTKYDKLSNYKIEPIPYKIVELYRKIVQISKGE